MPIESFLSRIRQNSQGADFVSSSLDPKWYKGEVIRYAISPKCEFEGQKIHF
jgi:hypothetical protein